MLLGQRRADASRAALDVANFAAARRLGVEDVDAAAIPRIRQLMRDVNAISGRAAMSAEPSTEAEATVLEGLIRLALSASQNIADSALSAAGTDRVKLEGAADSLRRVARCDARKLTEQAERSTGEAGAGARLLGRAHAAATIANEVSLELRAKLIRLSNAEDLEHAQRLMETVDRLDQSAQRTIETAMTAADELSALETYERATTAALEAHALASAVLGRFEDKGDDPVEGGLGTALATLTTASACLLRFKARQDELKDHEAAAMASSLESEAAVRSVTSLPDSMLEQSDAGTHLGLNIAILQRAHSAHSVSKRERKDRREGASLSLSARERREAKQRAEARVEALAMRRAERRVAEVEELRRKFETGVSKYKYVPWSDDGGHDVGTLCAHAHAPAWPAVSAR